MALTSVAGSARAVGTGVAPTILCAYAGIVHLAVVPQHWGEWPGYAAFFLATGAAQIAVAIVWVRRGLPHRAVLLTIGATTAIVLLYVASRTVGVPVGPEHGGHRREPAGPADLAVTAAELGVVASLIPALPPLARRRVLDSLLAIGVALWGWRLVADLV